MLTTSEELLLPVMVPVAQISPSPVNENREGKDQDIEGLAADIKSKGLLQPISVRPKTDGYEIIFGERRWNAFKFLKRDQIPAYVKDVNDREAHAMTFSENFQRKNLSPLEEAIALQVLLSDGMTPEEIAVQFGRDIKWVSRRLKLSNLSDKIREAYLTGKLYAWGPAHLETIARFEIHTQNAFSKEYQVYGSELNDENYDFEALNHLTIDELRESFDHFLMQLSSVPWDLNDNELYSNAGACTTCLKRTSVQTNLFETIEVKGKVLDACIDPECYETKQNLFTRKRLEKLQEKNPEIVKLTTVYRSKGSTKEEELDDVQRGAIYQHHATECKKTDPGAKQAIITDGPNAGTTKWVKLPEETRVKREKTDVDVKVKYNLKKKTAVINAMIAFLTSELKTPKESEKILIQEILPVIVIFGCDNIESLPEDIFCNTDFSFDDEWKNISIFKKQYNEDDQITRLLTLVFPRWMKNLKSTLDKNFPSGPDHGMTMAENIAKFFKLDWESFCSQAHASVKIPKKVQEQLNQEESAKQQEDQKTKKGKKSSKKIDDLITDKKPAKKKSTKAKKAKEHSPDEGSESTDDEFYTNDPENLCED